MRRLTISLILILAACTSRPSPTPAPTDPPRATQTPVPQTEGEPLLVFYVSEVGGFQAWLPVSGGIREYGLTVLQAGLELACTRWVSSLNGAFAVVQHCDLPPEAITVDSGFLFDAAQRTLAEDFNLQVDGEERSSGEDGRPEQFLWGQADLNGLGLGNEFEARLVLSGRSLYTILMAVHYANDCLCRHLIGQVVDSLYIDDPDP